MASPIRATGGGVSEFYSAYVNNRPIQFYYNGYPAYLQSLNTGSLVISNGQAKVAGASTDLTAKFIDIRENDVYGPNTGFENRRDKFRRRIAKGATSDLVAGLYDKQLNFMLP